MNTRIIKLHRQSKKLTDSYNQINKGNDDMLEQIERFHKKLVYSENQVKQLKNMVLVFQNKLEDLKCLDHNLDTVFGEINNVKEYSCECQNELLRNLAGYQSRLMHLENLINLQENKLNIGDLLYLNHSSISKNNWAITFQDSKIILKYLEQTIAILSIENPLLQLNCLGQANHGIFNNYQINLSIKPELEEKLVINCTEFDIPTANLSPSPAQSE
jgi:DNA repair exonuclease SbcCD ATPase subunit